MFTQAEVIEALAPAIHETWRSLSRKEGWNMQPHLDQPYETLAPGDKRGKPRGGATDPGDRGTRWTRPREGGIRFAARADTRQRNQGSPRAPPRATQAEAEHDGWMTHRLRNGWRFTRHATTCRNSTTRCFRTEARWRRQKKDRHSVRHFPDMVSSGYELVVLGEESDTQRRP